MATAPGRVEIDYPHRRAGHCGSGSFRDLLEFHGLSWFDQPMSEGMAFGLGAGLGFAYVEIPGMQPPLYMVGRGATMERDFCEHLGIPVENRHTDDPSEGWDMVRERLDAGLPTMVNADIAHLEYLRVRLQMTMHVIVITGYDEAQGVAFIADNDRDEIQHCSLPALAAARHSDGFPAPNRHSTWLMDFPEALPEPGPVVERAVRRAVEHMRGAMSDSLGAPPEAMGIAGVGTFADGYAGWPERFGDGLADALHGLRVFIVKAGTGGAMFRSLHAEFLGDAARLLGDESLAEAARAYDALAAEWVALAEAVSAEGAGPDGAHAAGTPHVARIADLERSGLQAMERWPAGR